jgi:hypothetical protein
MSPLPSGQSFLSSFFDPEDEGHMFLLNVGFLLGLYFYPEDGSKLFLRNVC